MNADAFGKKCEHNTRTLSNSDAINAYRVQNSPLFYKVFSARPSQNDPNRFGRCRKTHQNERTYSTSAVAKVKGLSPSAAEPGGQLGDSPPGLWSALISWVLDRFCQKLNCLRFNRFPVDFRGVFMIWRFWMPSWLITKIRLKFYFQKRSKTGFIMIFIRFGDWKMHVQLCYPTCGAA